MSPFLLPQLDQHLSNEHLNFLQTFTKSCRRSILEMVTNAQSGHPGGSLSCIDYLALIYCFIISHAGDHVVVSNGHISPAVYSILAELNYIPKNEVIKNFRQIDSIYEGHVTRHVPGVLYGTGPLGIGFSAASGFALAEKLKNSNKKTFCLVGDGEAQEGQVYEVMNFSNKYQLNNLITFIDSNKIQLSASLKEIMPLDIPAIFAAGGWQVIDVDGHDYQKMWQALNEAYQIKDRPIVLIGHTVMGQGVDFMEPDGQKHLASWHGKAPKPDQTIEALKKLELTETEKTQIADFIKQIKWQPPKPNFIKNLTPIKIDTGEIISYDSKTLTDCRTAYGKALLDLAKRNPQIIALTADLRESVMTKFVHDELPNQHFEVGIAEQHMVSCSGGLSLNGFIPFCSTFGAFMTSRAKDQARVNDINRTNVKMVATHCGLSVGEDGPTHQAIDDMGSFLGLFNTNVIEPADPNQTDRIIRYIASRYGNFYVRMGRHKFPVITKPDGSIFYDAKYIYEYGQTDVIRAGEKLTIAATGAMIHESLKALEKLPANTVELIAVSSIKKFDDTLISSIKKTKKLITVEDHNTFSGLGSQLARHLELNNIKLDHFQMIGVEAYQLSGKTEELYQAAKIDSENIAIAIKKLFPE